MGGYLYIAIEQVLENGGGHDSRKEYDFIAVTNHRNVYQQNGREPTSPLLVIEDIELDGRDERDATLHGLAIGVSD
ncbi:MAG: hypothetical protein PVJ06_02905 [Desulfobacterales bacterium]|jgi:hypothetical protein